MDVLYVVGKGSSWDHNELRFSLRSVARNFPHDRVIVSGHCPLWLSKEVVRLHYNDPGRERGRNSLSKALWALESGKVGERFALFCDDFYILKPWTCDAMRYVGHLKDRVKKARSTRPAGEQWRKMIEATMKTCEAMGLPDPLDFGAHHPFVMERDKATEALRHSLSLPVAVDVNTLYCAMFGGDVMKVKQAKLPTWSGPPQGEVYSSKPEIERLKAFRNWVGSEFPDPCPYER